MNHLRTLPCLVGTLVRTTDSHSTRYTTCRRAFGRPRGKITNAPFYKKDYPLLKHTFCCKYMRVSVQGSASGATIILFPSLLSRPDISLPATIQRRTAIPIMASPPCTYFVVVPLYKQYGHQSFPRRGTMGPVPEPDPQEMPTRYYAQEMPAKVPWHTGSEATRGWPTTTSQKRRRRRLWLRGKSISLLGRTQTELCLGLGVARARSSILCIFRAELSTGTT